jgi:methionyl-tRNA formyltransferase
MSTPYVLLGNGRVALRFLHAVAERGDLPTRVVLNEVAKQRDARELRDACARAGVTVDAWSPEVRSRLLRSGGSATRPWLLSVYFGHILDSELLAAFAGRAVNLHAALLPWCRGAHTNVWPIVDRSPAGVTLHAMTSKVDAGAILAQAEVVVNPWDTAATLYARLEDAGVELLMKAWPGEILARWPGTPQGQGGSYHALKDFASLDRYDLDEHPEARRFFDLLRARSFPPHGGLVVTVEGKAVEARIELKEATDG